MGQPERNMVLTWASRAVLQGRDDAGVKAYLRHHLFRLKTMCMVDGLNLRDLEIEVEAFGTPRGATLKEQEPPSA